MRIVFIGFDLQKLNREEIAVDHLRCTSRQGSVFHLENTSLPDDNRNRFSHVQISANSRLDCWQCVNTLPDFICSHIIFCLCQMQQGEVDSFWKSVQPAKPTLPAANAFSKKSGLKPSDRIGNAKSARNHIRKIADISSMTFLTNSSSSSPQAHSSSLHLSFFSPNQSHITPPVASPTPSNLLQSPAPSQNSPSTSDVPSSYSSGSTIRRSLRKRKQMRAYSPSYGNSLNSNSPNSTIH